MALSVKDAWADVKGRVKNIGDIPAAQQLKQASIVNGQIRAEIMISDPSRLLLSSADTTLTSDNQSFTNPTLFKNMTADGAGIFFVNSDDTLGNQVPKIVEGSGRSGWFPTSTGFTIIGNSGMIVRQKYIPKLADFAADTENFVVDEEYRELVTLGLLVRYYFNKGEFKDIDYQNWNAEYIQALTEFSDDIMRDSGVSSLEDHSDTYDG
ncbi:MAG: hypothetical protein WCY05_06480 [Candidatus Omnitrophota bacterium]